MYHAISMCHLHSSHLVHKINHWVAPDLHFGNTAYRPSRYKSVHYERERHNYNSHGTLIFLILKHLKDIACIVSINVVLKGDKNFITHQALK